MEGELEIELPGQADIRRFPLPGLSPDVSESPRSSSRPTRSLPAPERYACAFNVWSVGGRQAGILRSLCPWRPSRRSDQIASGQSSETTFFAAATRADASTEDRSPLSASTPTLPTKFMSD